MIRKYYELVDDLDFEGRWHLTGLCDSAGNEFDEREFRYGNHIDVGPPLKCYLWNEDRTVNVVPPLKLTLSRSGTPLDFTFTDSDMPVVTSDVAAILARIAGNTIQQFPVRVQGIAAEFAIINVTCRVDCIDAERSDIEWWLEGNDIRPDRAGKPHVISTLIIDATRVKNNHIFRPEDWEISIIVSDLVKEAFEEARVSGVKFKEV